ncbi:MAG: hypothetical protein HC941_31105 [Microcoleus sp. SU_5_3]|nr:hypothetical protein [Microcoleus sp. SU_5_3]
MPLVEGNEGDPHIISIVAIEPTPEEGFVTASQSICKQLFHPTSRSDRSLN